MADMATILDDLTTEVREAICAIAPNTMAGEKNNFKSPKSLQKQDIREQTGNPRLFEVTWGLPTQMDGGHTQKTWDVPGSITIGYPIDTDWNVAKASDVQQIFDTLNQTDSGVTGVNVRHMPQGEDPETEEADDDWTWVMIPLRAVVTTT